MNTQELPTHEKAGRMDAALRAERNFQRKKGTLYIANAINTYLQNADQDSKARFYDLVRSCDTPAEALAESEIIST